MEVFADYQLTLLIVGLTGLLLLTQILVSDAASIKLKHTPGYPVEADHARFLFRASRTYSNTNETIAVFILFALFAVYSGADASYIDAFSVTYFAGRVMHMLCYYANIALARSIGFVISLIGLIGMFVTSLTV
ncbi:MULTISPECIES: MAPEG family protein [unclassified Oleiphilus]|jgi:uncharacterized MAPEG superfamily protein|nr:MULTISPECIES: MAPEG family protein [unclassified Oleiphilus]KZY47836.1 hypothetical protein A3732_00825 [Oleiphilus sp. HI0050]KZY76548.1 hypothetical protein A3740_01865 [Oleiphilus sp. HI0068]KZY80773.1 hypothetical protein A3741_00760 [Oleiphilus sp. HI0069]KZY88962.1 hypothetical protein A3743_01170 [Oleiphilus sp. HI0072]KZZ09975.1 hypothetical protein A3749_00145 [Oleiphilus sp. HI0078]KZZ19012.1 hypothetical protein A3752_15885 [Oleiphilus sp. HI0081]KZZ45949.1 hypothetical protein